MFIDKNGSKRGKIYAVSMLLAVILFQTSAIVIMKYIALRATSLADMFTFELFYVVFILLVFHAIFWPIILHHIELSYANSANSIIPVLLLGCAYFLYKENVELKHLLGGGIIIVGNIMIFIKKS